MLLTIDVGGTSVKYALFDGEKLSQNGAFDTPDNYEDFLSNLTNVVDKFKAEQNLTGVAMSAPGAVNKQTGVIEGASALPYIHNFEIQKDFENAFGLPVSIENDANCAALAEVGFGAAKGLKNVLFIVLGTGVGGAVVFDGKIHHGKHLMGGEFGFMLMDDENSFSTLGTAVEMAKRYNEKTSSNLTGMEIFELAFEKQDETAKAEVEIFLFNVAKGIFNLQYAFDPELIILGGGVSAAEWLIPELNKQLETIKEKLEIPPFIPEIATCHFKNDANLIGAAADFGQTYPELN